MKTILAPTDFSKTADNAVLYAARLAKAMHARLVLVHAYHVPVQVSEIPFTTISEVQLKKANASALAKVEKRVQSRVSGVKTECIVRNGFAVDVIKDVAAEKHADLVLMGITGAGALDRTIIGSVTLDTVRNVQVPVIIVPQKAKFQNLGKIVFAYDYTGEKDEQAIKALLDFVKQFNARLMVANVISEDDPATFKKAIAGIKMENMLAHVPHTLHFPVNDSVTDGISDFVRDTNAGMIAMIAHKHNVFYRLFNMSNTKRMAFSTDVPLLAIPEAVAVKAKVRQKRTLLLA